MRLNFKHSLAVTGVLSALGAFLPAAASASSANDFSNSRIVSVAEQSPNGAYGGQCYVFVSNSVYRASGDRIRIEGAHTYYGAYQRAGAKLESAAGARPGDIIQVYDRYNDDTYVEGMHTAIITANLGGGRFDVIDSNWGFTERVHRHELDPYTQLAAGNSALRVAIWRVGQVGSSTPAPAPAPTPTPVPIHTQPHGPSITVPLPNPSPTPAPPPSPTPGPLTHTFHVYGVPAGQSLLERTGPGTSYSYLGTRLYNGAAVQILCQYAGSLVAGTTAIWDFVEPGVWVTDYYINTPEVGVFTPGIAHCGDTSPLIG